MLARFFVYQSAGPITRQLQWIVRDFVMNVPRAVCAVVAFLILRRLWRSERVFGFAETKAALGFLLLFCGVGMLEYVGGTKDLWPGLRPFVIVTIGSVFVAFWEELTYRGLLLRGLLETTSPRVAVIASSFVFMAMHLQATSVERLPTLFLDGILLACARLRGVGLGWLIVSHALFDSLIFFGSDKPYRMPYHGLAFLLLLFVATMIYWLRTPAPAWAEAAAEQVPR